uniref:Uncharacterized protein LOC110216563 n=1 Tax=Phascolarctos cinereus TaxID=38626 RepID=A0A6P5L7R1_PHACI|nr:uncharacterized protein LOC110216563 [Phascolarctos cinereus]
MNKTISQIRAFFLSAPSTFNGTHSFLIPLLIEGDLTLGNAHSSLPPSPVLWTRQPLKHSKAAVYQAAFHSPPRIPCVSEELSAGRHHRSLPGRGLARRRPTILRRAPLPRRRFRISKESLVSTRVLLENVLSNPKSSHVLLPLSNPRRAPSSRAAEEREQYALFCRPKPPFLREPGRARAPSLWSLLPPLLATPLLARSRRASTRLLPPRLFGGGRGGARSSGLGSIAPPPRVLRGAGRTRLVTPSSLRPRPSSTPNSVSEGLVGVLGAFQR